MSKGPKTKTVKTAVSAKPKTKAKTTAKTKAKSKVQAQASPPVEAKAPPVVQESPKAAAETVPAAKTSRGSLAAVSVVIFLTVIGVSTYMTWYYWSATVEPYLPGNKAAPEASVAPAPAPEAAPAPDAAKAPVSAPDKTPAPVENEAANKVANGAVNGAAMEKMAAESRQLRQSLDRLLARIESIEKAVENVKKLAQATTLPSENLETDPVLEILIGRLSALEESGGTVKALIVRVDRMEKNSAALSQAKAKADTEADTVQTAAEPGPGNSASVSAKAMVLAVAELRQAITFDKPFTQALDALAALAGDNPDFNVAIAVLAKSAKAGIPTLDILRNRFEGLAGKIVQSSRTLKENGWVDRAANRFSSIIRWRRIDGKGDESSIDAMVAAAETHLRTGDLKAAINALEDLSGNAAAAAVAAPWLGDAKARLAAEDAVASLHLLAISILTAVKPAEG